MNYDFAILWFDEDGDEGFDLSYDNVIAIEPFKENSWNGDKDMICIEWIKQNRKNKENDKVVAFQIRRNGRWSPLYEGTDILFYQACMTSIAFKDCYPDCLVFKPVQCSYYMKWLNENRDIDIEKIEENEMKKFIKNKINAVDKMLKTMNDGKQIICKNVYELALLEEVTNECFTL